VKSGVLYELLFMATEFLCLDTPAFAAGFGAETDPTPNAWTVFC
jgi:hypothetical protein